jgi:hypothetical protein
LSLEGSHLYLSVKGERSHYYTSYLASTDMDALSLKCNNSKVDDEVKMKNTVFYLYVQAKQKGMTTYQTNLSRTNLQEEIILNPKNIKELLVNDKTNFIHAITDSLFL